MPQVIGRKSKRKRTNDVELVDVSFQQLYLSEDLHKGLKAAGYEKPSPIQLQAIPLALFGTDLIAQAKAGTGKTLVFTTVGLEIVDRMLQQPQVLILAPTREIAFQIHSVLTLVSAYYSPPIKATLLVGGYPLSMDAQALRGGTQIIIGTPGRIISVFKASIISFSSIRLLVLDEADKLLEESFDKQLNQILDYLPQRKQIIALSATFNKEMISKMESKMNNPQKVLLSEEKPSLNGVKQYYSLIKIDNTATSFVLQKYEIFKEKSKQLLTLLRKLRFHQCLVFCNQRDFAQKLCNTLTKHGWANKFISGAHDQAARTEAMEALRNFSLRVLVSTDLTSRGVDVERVNLVMNLDLPQDPETYLHRIGRTGRFGSYGVAVSFVTESELVILQNIQKKYSSTVELLPEVIPPHFYAYYIAEEAEKKKLEEMENQRAVQLEENKVKRQKVTDI